ncbi:MAG TPA: DUF2085 domain-containing protein [Vicinamibacterales bacterium]|nr:DUF2085 domain-containing protein [Vicinamibacterales bacterium]
MPARLLASATLAWLLFLAAGWWSAETGRATWFGPAVYLTAGRVCHQRPDRSFQTAGVQWPVCGRCAGLYLAAPIGAWAALIAARPRATRRSSNVGWFLVAAMPSALTFAIEFLGIAPVSSLARALAALPLGAAIAYFLVAVTRARHGRPSAKLSSACVRIP